ncbi:SusC/RagA family TonB-linked outer membrane protein [Bacteroides nordii]|uniref:SusC/RagA family TonB-linked outer membrane protein n=1 Tax=Bacteroides nordii TaxID=291645 RepID=UPI00203CABA1|nr:SusC/RagA family TonB-linked outer membrane protein [Bacteroides nordii]GFZ40786.1 SusC/RagA family TonB-linked outer membrane protein [Bacteroides nordii]
MKKQLLVLLFFFSAVAAYSQHTITGVVTSSEDGMPVIGASVVVKGNASLGTITDIDGNYSIKAPDNSTLVFSYVGMETQEVKAGKQSVINVVMKPSSIMVDEVVVTAMGVKAEKKKLNYAVQSLDSKEIMGGANTNFVNTLQGKISGLSVSTSGGSPNAESQIQIRGISSINGTQNNEPLLIIDGIAVSGAGVASQINPADIENMTVLKGAAASALYGQEAANGVIMITTKNGKEGKITVNANASVQVENVFHLPKLQTTYVPGVKGVLSEKVDITGGWGPMVQPGETIYDNVSNFFQMGLSQKYDVSLSGGTDKFTAYASASYSMTDGVVPNDYQDRLNFLLKGTYEVSKHLKASLSGNIIRTKSRGAGDVLSTVYNWPINNDIRDYIKPNGTPNWLHPFDGLTDDEIVKIPLSPLWSRYMDQGENNAARNIIMGNIVWNPVKGLELSGRVSFDENHYTSESITAPLFDKSDFSNPENIDLAKFGEYNYSQSRSQLLTVQALATYKLELPKDFNLNFLAGYELKERKGTEAAFGGAGFQIPGFESISNLPALELGKNTSLSHSLKRMLGYFGEIRLDYKGIAHVSATARQDYSSTLSETSYFYPSVTGGFIFTELFKISSETFSYGKIRGNWAKVGKDTNPYAFDKRFIQKASFPDGGYGVDPAKSRAVWLDPEMASSWEIGLDLRFFNDKTKLDIAYYNTTVDNQIVNVRVSPTKGTILQIRNEGYIENQGVELQLNQEIIRTRDFFWNANLNFGLNRGRVKGLPDDITEIQGKQFSDLFPVAYLHGPTMGISGKDYERTPDGQIVCDEEGYPVISPAKGNLIGNREPDFLLGISSNLNWKNFTLSFLVDTRKGGTVANMTERSLFSSGQSRFVEKYRNREVVVKGMVKQADGTYVENTKPILLTQTVLSEKFGNVSSNFLEDGSYVRLSYVTLGYDFTPLLKKSFVKGLQFSITGRNLLLLTKYTGCDPQISAGKAGGTGNTGIDDFKVPSTRSFNFSINATF